MRIRWTPAAAADLDEIHRYLKEHYPHLATSTISELYDGIRSLRNFPHRGRPGREEGTRELIFVPLPFIAAYRVKELTIEILHIHHGARKRT
jgi:addiction module RelE/StbE family toxin